MGAEFRVFDEAIDIWKTVEARWGDLAVGAISARGSFTVALSGGRTPVGLYCHLSRRVDIPWRDTDIFMVDERFVPPESRESNSRMIRNSLLKGKDVEPRSFHSITTGEVTAEASAERYQEELRTFFGEPSGGRPSLDLIILGIGEDGHTASLFPGGRELEEREKWVTASDSGTAPHRRITMTLPVLNAARHIIFLATGASKAAVIRDVLKGGEKPSRPASMVRPAGGSITFYLDRQAASRL